MQAPSSGEARMCSIHTTSQLRIMDEEECALESGRNGGRESP